jgi:multidrug efflux pump subunit AcrB
MAFSKGDGAAMRSPLAVTVAFGLIASTCLTLFVIPCLFSSMETIGSKIFRKKEGVQVIGN